MRKFFAFFILILIGATAYFVVHNKNESFKKAQQEIKENVSKTYRVKTLAAARLGYSISRPHLSPRERKRYVGILHRLESSSTTSVQNYLQLLSHKLRTPTPGKKKQAYQKVIQLIAKVKEIGELQFQVFHGTRRPTKWHIIYSIQVDLNNIKHRFKKLFQKLKPPRVVQPEDTCQ